MDQAAISDNKDSIKVTFAEAAYVWLKIALNSFGGPAGQIAVMHRSLVEEKQWISESRFLHALNYCMLLPGPEAQQLATYLGWLLHRVKGGLVAGCLFILPGFLAILGLSVLYASFQDVTFVQALFYGLKPAVMAVVLGALIKIGKRVIKNRSMVGIAALAFISIFFFDVPFPLIVITAGGLGFIGYRRWPNVFDVLNRNDVDSGVDATTLPVKPTLKRAFQVSAISVTLWFGPLIGLALWLGADSVFVQEGLFFSQTAVVTFGGAYAVLAFIAQQAVDVFGWLQPGEMLDGLGMAETTPGPLIQVVQFVGFMGAYRNATPFDPMTSAIIGSIVTVWVTFVPCFFWIFLGAPYVEALRGNRALTASLSTITAAVVGVILNLAVWFSLHTLFSQVDETIWYGIHFMLPNWVTLDWMGLIIAVVAFIALIKFKVGMMWTLFGSASLGLLYSLFFLN
jgi:chromate transporter